MYIRKAESKLVLLLFYPKHKIRSRKSPYAFLYIKRFYISQT